jgi:copper homeostasis protein
MILEVIVQSVADARAAADGGADRLEVVRAIEEGGLTPPFSLVRRIAEATALPLRVMVRDNAGYATTPTELALLRRQAGVLADAGIDGIVAGFADAGKLRLDDFARVIDAAPGVRFTFHRAFDTLDDPLGAVRALARVSAIDSILTSGGGGNARERCARLRELAARAGRRLRIIAGGGVDEEMFEEVARSGCVNEVHVGRLARDRWDQRAPVSHARVRRLRAIADGVRV